MTTTKDLQQQIAELTAKHNLQKLVENKLPGMGTIYTNEFNYKSKGTKYTFTVNLLKSDLKDIQSKINEVITAFPPTKNNLLSFAGKDDQLTASPFVLRFKNGVRDNSVQIEYVSGDFWAHIELPIAYYSDDCKGIFMRKVYDCEYHYFTGTSMKEILKIQLRAYKLDMFESVKYYGGDVANFIKDNEDKEEFESIVINGHIPQFVEYWQNSLKAN